MQANKLSLVLVLCVLLLGLQSVSSPPTAAQTNVNAGPPRGILVDAQRGWLLFNQHLYWTSDAGTSWRAITPPLAADMQIQAVAFADTKHGRVVLSQIANASTRRYALASTDDAGSTWRVTSQDFFSDSNVDAPTSSVFMQWLDGQIGWIVFKRASGASFSIGTIFHTTDGGNSWSSSPVPIAEQPYFIDSTFGWLAGGPGGAELYRTIDGGNTWRRVEVSVVKSNRASGYLVPRFRGRQDGLLPVILNGNTLSLFMSNDGGNSWSEYRQFDLGVEIAPGVRPPLSLIDPDNWIAIAPASGRATRSTDGVVTSQNSDNTFLRQVTDLQMADSASGWTWTNSGNCTDSHGVRQCTTDTHLLRTSDGGRSWQTLALPENTVRTYSAAPKRVATPSSPNISKIEQGFDACGAGSIEQMQDWWDNSPYKYVNLYIGGSALAVGCTPITPGYVSALYWQGWRFIPTWVGPQAPCMGYRSSISWDPWTAYGQGVGEAITAINVARTLGLTYSDYAGSVIYYDMENYTETDYACRTAVNFFLTGWAAQIQLLGSKAGGYATATDIYTSWASLTPPLDAVWIAHWTDTSYNPGQTVWDNVLPDGLWTNHQRIKQYAGGHWETWGSSTLNIDNDVIDGPVARIPPPNSVSVILARVVDNAGAPKGDIFPNDSVGLTAAINNTDPITNSVLLQAIITGECGPFVNYGVSYSAPPGVSAWGDYKTVPSLLCNGPATFQVRSSFHGYVTSQTFPVTVHGLTRHFFLPLLSHY